MSEEDKKENILEKEYQEIINLINSQIAVATACLNDAAVLAHRKGSNLKNFANQVDNLIDDQDLNLSSLDFSPLKRAIRVCGWNSSSMDC